jgi:hypothetical protein
MTREKKKTVRLGHQASVNPHALEGCQPDGDRVNWGVAEIISAHGLGSGRVRFCALSDVADCVTSSWPALRGPRH